MTKRPARQTLYNLYVEQRLTGCQIAKLYSVTDPTVYRWLRQYNIPVRRTTDYTRAIPESEESRVIRAYHSGTSAPTIARTYGCGYQAVYNILRKHNIPRRQKAHKSAAHRDLLLQCYEQDIHPERAALICRLSRSPVYRFYREQRQKEQQEEATG